MVIAFIIVVVFIFGLVMFVKRWPEIKKAAQDGWREGSKKKGD